MPRAIRLTVTQGADGRPRLIGVDSLDDIALPEASVPSLNQIDDAPPPGLFLQSRSASSELLAERMIDQEDFASVEFPTGDPDQPFGRVASPVGVLRSYLIPVDDDTARVAMVRRWRGAGEEGGLASLASAEEQSEEIFSVDLGSSEGAEQ